MSSLAQILMVVGGVVAGVLLDRLYIHFRRDELKEPVNPLPGFQADEVGINHETLNIYLKEWEVIISTQMHFNDLILRFRSIILTAFITMIGVIFAAKNFIVTVQIDPILILMLPGTLWITALMIDLGYYHRLLLGAVAQARKFDESKTSKEYGLFGMSECIKKYVHPPTSELLVIIFYVLPAVAVGILYFSVF